MDIGEPDNSMAITELVAHLTSSSGATLRQVTVSQVDVMRISRQRQQLDVTAEEQYANRLHLAYNQAIHAMETHMSLQQVQDLGHVEAQARSYYHSRWTSLEE
eukprot:5891254-Amphidinium_carterae.1